MTDRKALSSHGLSRQNGLGTQELPQAVHEKIPARCATTLARSGSDPADPWHPRHPNTPRRRCRTDRCRTCEGRPHRRKGFGCSGALGCSGSLLGAECSRSQRAGGENENLGKSEHPEVVPLADRSRCAPGVRQPRSDADRTTDLSVPHRPTGDESGGHREAVRDSAPTSQALGPRRMSA